MKRFIDGIIEILYPRLPGEPDRSTLWEKVAVLAMLGAILVLGIAANWR